MAENLTMAIANLHDAFLNASIQFDRMQKEPVGQDPEFFMVSDRGRFERAWLAFLYVLVECWRSDQMRPARQEVLRRVSDCCIDDLVGEGEANGALAALREVRHYMCHRDLREYWNEGRTAVTNLDYNRRLHAEFGRALLLTMKSRRMDGTG